MKKPSNTQCTFEAMASKVAQVKVGMELKITSKNEMMFCGIKMWDGMKRLVGIFQKFNQNVVPNKGM